jgi:arginase family enzyme
MMAGTAAAGFAELVREWYEDSTLIRVAIPKPVISDLVHGYFSEIVLPAEQAGDADVVMLGFPIDIGASYRMIPGIRPSGGSPSECSMGVRRGLGFCRTYAFALDVDLATSIRVADVGNVLIGNRDRYEEAFAKFSTVYREILKLGVTPLVLGGDNSTSYISLKNFTEHSVGKVGLIWLDAHTDTAMDYRGDRYWCGSPMARILELPRDRIDPANVVMLGIRGFDHSAAMIETALDAGAHLFPAERVMERGMLAVAQEILEIVQDGTTSFYVMWDPDVMEAVYIPGHAVPTTGGIHPHHLKQLLRMCGLCGVGGFEVVEVAPGMDVRDMTIRLASESVLELIAGLARCKADGVRTPAEAAEVVRQSFEPRRAS